MSFAEKKFYSSEKCMLNFSENTVLFLSKNKKETKR